MLFLPTNPHRAFPGRIEHHAGQWTVYPYPQQIPSYQNAITTTPRNQTSTTTTHRDGGGGTP